MSKVYIKTDSENRIIRVDGGYTESNIEDVSEWILVDEGEGDRYNLCQSNYLPKPLHEDNGIPQYKYVDGEILERTAEEIEADIPPVVVEPTQLDRVEAQTMWTALMTGTLIEEV